MRQEWSMIVLVLAFIFAAVEAQDLCLPNAVVEQNINAIVIQRSNLLDLCESDDFAEFLENQVRRNYRPPQDSRCCLMGIRRTHCEDIALRNGVQHQRVHLYLRANLTCDTKNCKRHTSDRDSLEFMKDREDLIRTAMRATSKSEAILYRRRDTVRLFYFIGKKGRVLEECPHSQSEETVRGKHVLCNCPESCPQLTPKPSTGEPVTPEPSTAEPVTPEPSTAEPVTPEPSTTELVTKGLLTCPSGKEYRLCGAVVCEPHICTCIRGCFCPDGQVERDDGGCVEEDNDDDPNENKRDGSGSGKYLDSDLEE